MLTTDDRNSEMAEIEDELLNPFIHHLELTTTCDKIKTGIFTLVVMPIRIIIIAGLLVFAWLLACVGLWGLTQEDLVKHPMKGWRLVTKKLGRVVLRLIWMALGFYYVKTKGTKASAKEARLFVAAPHSSFHDALLLIFLGAPSVVSKIENSNIPVFGSMWIAFYAQFGISTACTIRGWICTLGCKAYHAGGMQLTVKGTQASSSEAPILVIAPHSTFLDAVVVYVTGFPSIIVRSESGMNPWLGKLINFTQPVYVGRNDPDSRHKTIQDIINRTTSNENWPQVLIFPEGTCTNRSCLIQFKPGAFYPGVPVQPVLIRYPNKMDTVTWTWDGPGALKLLWLTLTQVHSRCEIEFLPVYVPSETEKADPKLYAHNVRKLMAKALGVPTSEYTYEDCMLVKKAKDLQLSKSSKLIQTHKLRCRLGVHEYLSHAALRSTVFSFILINVLNQILISGLRSYVEIQEIFFIHHQFNENLCQSLTSHKLEDNLIAIRKQEILDDKEMYVTLKELSEILNVPETDHNLLELFQLYSEEKNGTTVIDWKTYALAATLVDKANSKTHMIKLAFEFFDDDMNKTWLQYFMSLIYSVSYSHSESVFNDITSHKKSTIRFDEFSSYIDMYPDTLMENNNMNGTKNCKKKV